MREKAGEVILSFHSEDEEGGDRVEGEGVFDQRGGHQLELGACLDCRLAFRPQLRV
jgi:hypothetical protein